MGKQIDFSLQWAENEVKLAIEYLKKHGAYFHDPDLQLRQYQDALSIYHKFHLEKTREMSTSIVNYIVDHLINAIPLTDLTDSPKEWDKHPSLYIAMDMEVEYYTHKRYPKLCKRVFPDGSVKYNDTRRIKFYSIRNPAQTLDDYECHLILDKLRPITMPYLPSLQPYKMIGETFLTNSKNGDYDTVGYFYIKCPTGDMISINRFYKIEGDTTREITNLEYNYRKQHEV